MNNLTCYADASGHPDEQDSLIVCGLVSRDRTWMRFEERWPAALQAAGLPRSFHTAPFMACRGEYADWLSRPEQRIAAVQLLVKDIRKHVHRAFATTIFVSDWQAVDAQFKLRESGWDPYSIAGYFVMHRSSEWRAQKHPRTQMRFVFEEGDKGQKSFTRHMRQIVSSGRYEHLEIAEPSFVPKGCAALQAVDFVAWIRNRAVRHWLAGTTERSLPHPVVSPLIELFNDSTFPSRWGYLDEARLLDFCVLEQITRRDPDNQG